MRINFQIWVCQRVKNEIVGADVLDGPIPTQLDSLLGKDYLRGVGTSPPTFG